MQGFPGGSDGKESACNAGDPHSIPGSGSPGQEDPWRKKWQLAPVFVPGEPHGWRSLEGCGPQGRKEPDTTEGPGKRAV